MHCPNCKTQSLKPMKLEAGLVALGCTDCNGTLLPLLPYRDWLERQGDQAFAKEHVEIVADDSRQALQCPKCERLMAKFGIAAESDHRLDLCNHCYEAWLDAGEWELLQQLELADKLPSIFTDGWQTHVRRGKADAFRAERDSERLGESFDQAAAFKEWLNDQPQRQEILQYLQRQS